jgi:hypothetical protein
MRKRVLTGVGLAVALAASYLALAVAKPITVTVGNLVLKIDSSITPKAISKHELTPITFRINARISTKNRRHPPAARTFEGEADRNGALNPKGLPTCRRGQLEARPTSAVEAACGRAIVGKGFAEAEVEFPEHAPFDARGPLLVLNGGGSPAKTMILVHIYANVPAPTVFIVPVTVTKIDNGKYGLRIDSQIPVIANGAGSLTGFEITNEKTFTHRGKRQGYFLARCPGGRLFGRAEVTFASGDRLKGGIVVPCTPKG